MKLSSWSDDPVLTRKNAPSPPSPLQDPLASDRRLGKPSLSGPSLHASSTRDCAVRPGNNTYSQPKSSPSADSGTCSRTTGVSPSKSGTDSRWRLRKGEPQSRFEFRRLPHSRRIVHSCSSSTRVLPRFDDCEDTSEQPSDGRTRNGAARTTNGTSATSVDRDIVDCFPDPCLMQPCLTSKRASGTSTLGLAQR